MRVLVGLYLSIGVVLLLIGFLATGPCPDKNKDVVSNVVFVLGWPVYLYDDVVQGKAAAPQWLHRQACDGSASRAPTVTAHSTHRPTSAEAEFGAGAMAQPLAELGADRLRVRHGAVSLAAPLGRAVVRQQQGVEGQAVVDDRREAGDRGAA